MEGPRLTGLEFLWFGKGERLASDYQNRAAMDLEASVAALVAVVSDDAKFSSTGPESLRRVAARFDLEADRTAGAIIGTAGSPTAGPFAAKRRIVALRSLAVSFAASAVGVRECKQRSGPGTSPYLGALARRVLTSAMRTSISACAPTT